MTSGKSPTRKHEPETVHLWGGTLCLDFANSVDWSGDDEPLDDSDVLRDGDDVRRWAQRVGIYGARAPAVDDAALDAAADGCSSTAVAAVAGVRCRPAVAERRCDGSTSGAVGGAPTRPCRSPRRPC